ncbi:MAG: cytochrome c oxidase subunit IV [Limisphaerales bacterium]|jgi:cytochrome c oxidase subunit IV
MASHRTHEENVKLVWKVCGYLAIVTAFEIIAAYCHFSWFGLSEETMRSTKIYLNLLFIGLSVAKVYYIMSEFMHLKYELKPLTLSVLAPFAFLIWAIIAFSAEGLSWLDMRNFFG